MNYDLLENNKLYLQGIVEDEPVFNHSVYDEKFYGFNLRVPRLSGQDDIIPIIISEKIAQINDIKKNIKLSIRGQFRSYNKSEREKSKLILSVFCREICNPDEESNPNSIELAGYICKAPIFRTTPFNREITDVLVAVNRSYNKSDYIPCIAWGRNARFVADLPVGSKVEVSGRIQSREYSKKIEGEDASIVRIAYEVSVSKVTHIDVGQSASEAN